MSVSSALTVTTVDPRKLREKEIVGIHEVLQDMWADTVGELYQCRSCGHMHSKKDVYGRLSTSEYQRTVRELMGDFEMIASCQKCSGPVEYIYGSSNRKAIEDRLLKTKKAFLVLVLDEAGKIVGFEDAYIDTLESIFYREFETHYRYVGVEEIRRRIREALGHPADELVVLSDIGLLPHYRSFQNIYTVLQAITKVMTPEYDRWDGFTEIDEENSLHKVSSSLGGMSLGIREDPIQGPKISNTGQRYKSDLIVYHSVTSIYRRAFSGSMRDFLRLTLTPQAQNR